MAVITTDTFDPLKAWISVRLQQGVPIVDADWNEADDMRRFELRGYLKWFVGDGVPEGNDGFRIAPAIFAPQVNFSILTNPSVIPPGTPNFEVGLRHAGRCIVDGLDVLIAADTAFTSQPLHPIQPNYNNLATAWGVPPIDLTPLITNGVTSIAVYLDVWERLVTPTEAPGMILPALGIESCARRKREWVVRVATGNAAPVPATGHGHYLLALIVRPAAVPVDIQAAHITDRREQRLLVPPSTIIKDAFGGTVADYRRGAGRPAISLRDAINAIARGELPGSQSSFVSGGGANIWERAPQLVLDRSNGLVVAWDNLDLGPGPNRVAVARIDLGNVSAGFSAPVMFGPPAADADTPSPVVLPNGDLVVAFSKVVGGSFDLAFRRAASVAALAAALDQTIQATAGQNDDLPAAILSGSFVVFFYRMGNAQTLQYRRYQHVALSLDAAPNPVSGVAITAHHEAVDSGGMVWGAYVTAAGINLFRLDPVTNTISGTTNFNSAGPGQYERPRVVIAGATAWVFWESPEGLRAARFSSGSWSNLGLIPYSVAEDGNPGATVTSDGRILLLFTRPAVPNAGWGINAQVLDPVSAHFGPPIGIAVAPGVGSGSPMAVVAPDGAVWALWETFFQVSFSIRTVYKRIFTPL